jgi:hypothetical protein
LFCTEDDDDNAKSQAKSLKKMSKDIKDMKKAFTQLSQMKEEASNVSDSESEEASHFQFASFHPKQGVKRRNSYKAGLQFTQVEDNFSPQVTELFKQSHGKKEKLDLREIVLLDSQSTMDLFCDPALVNKSFKSKDSMSLRSNGGTMLVTRKAKVAGYHKEVWYDKKAITNIVALRNMQKQYRVTYDSLDQAFVVHRQDYGKPDMYFHEHQSGLHYYDPRKNEFTFVNTVTENLEGFSK